MNYFQNSPKKKCVLFNNKPNEDGHWCEEVDLCIIKSSAGQRKDTMAIERTWAELS